MFGFCLIFKSLSNTGEKIEGAQALSMREKFGLLPNNKLHFWCGSGVMYEIPYEFGRNMTEFQTKTSAEFFIPGDFLNNVLTAGELVDGYEWGKVEEAMAHDGSVCLSKSLSLNRVLQLAQAAKDFLTARTVDLEIGKLTADLERAQKAFSETDRLFREQKDESWAWQNKFFHEQAQRCRLEMTIREAVSELSQTRQFVKSRILKAIREKLAGAVSSPETQE